GSDTIEVAYLNGVDTPYIDQMDDGFEAFLNGKNVKTIPGTTSAESIIDYFKNHKPVTPDLTKRVMDVAK
ncbi:hypothetical protein O5287_28600, partial [Escherichia coli]|nr:hypothetical protein [Escherichia coli]